MNAGFMLRVFLLLLVGSLMISAKEAARNPECPYQELNVDTPAQLLNYWEVITDESLERLRESMLEKHICGNAYIRFLVDAAGTYKCYHIESEDHNLISETFLQQTLKMKFRPGMLQGKAVESWTRAIPFQVPCLGD